VNRPAQPDEADGIVAVDVGNSAVKLCVSGPDRTAAWKCFELAQANWPEAAVGWVSEAVGVADPEWRIASVHRTAADRLQEAILGSATEARIRRITSRDVPMRISVEFPARVGIDRLLGAWAAFRELETPVAVIDAGSAITVDWVDGCGDFQGGAILPGLRLQAASLASGTDGLPNIGDRWGRTRLGDTGGRPGERLAERGWLSEPPTIPGKNTEEAIRLGIVVGVAGAIDRIVGMYVSRSDRASAGVLLTGGDAPAISPHLKCRHRHRPDLVCRALADLPRLFAASGYRETSEG
jgi:type III pantothenate kinase